jgi:hypothetical protein
MKANKNRKIQYIGSKGSENICRVCFYELGTSSAYGIKLQQKYG